MKKYFSTLKKQANSRAKEATLSVLGINNPNLRKHLSENIDSDEQFVHGPVFEQMFGWESYFEKNMADLACDGLLSSKVVEALDSKNNGRYAFKKEWSPFRHQHKAWNDLLSSKPQSRIITSGTGSGKTECFMVPVLEDLYRETLEQNSHLTGVRALFLYPLNALINSQKERLNAWTQHFGGDIRFCLFNGKTPEKLTSKEQQIQKSKPQEVMSRKGLREDPSPILVTNGTMLEYMLVRQSDAAIIEKSKGKLRWIVLDEAHTYVGSQAAELALQLRRVMQAFDVKPEDIRFVATSATIAGDEAENSLKKYLAELANISIEQVDVIGGKRAVPELKKSDLKTMTIEQIEAIEPEGQPVQNNKESKISEISCKRYEALAQSKLARTLRYLLTQSNKSPQSIDELKHDLAEFNLTEHDIYRWLDICTATKPEKNSEAFLKLRAHYFQRTLQGLWSCIDPNCSEKYNTHLNENWPYGNVYTKQRIKCNCGAPVLELMFCDDCNAPHLIGVYNSQSSIEQWLNTEDDEFSLSEGEREEWDQESNDVQLPESANKTSEAIVISHVEDEEYGYHELLIAENGKVVFDNPKITLSVREDSKQICSDCGHKGRGLFAKPFRRAMLGAPFYTTNAVPTVLEYCPDFESENSDNKNGPNSLPARGRRLITFTDSRQGTAKISVSMQQEAERSHLRGIVVRELRKHLESKLDIKPEVMDRIQEYQSMSVDTLRAFLPSIKAVKPEDAVALEEYLECIEGDVGSKMIPTPITWQSLIDILKTDRDISHAMTVENAYLAPEVFKVDDATKLSEMLLTREVARRPKYRNNLETQGLVKLVYPGIDNLQSVPDNWSEHELSLKNWKDFLKVCLDFYVRENTFVEVNQEWSSWIGMHFYPKFLLSPESKEKEEGRVKKWPQVKTNQKRQQRLVSLLVKGAKLQLSNKQDEDIINLWLKSAWQALIDSKTLNEYAGKQYQLNLRTVSFSLMTKAYICPISHKLLDTTFKGISPYIPWNKNPEDYICEEIELPNVWEFDTSSDVSTFINEIRDNVANDPLVKILREQNLWTNINDRAIEGGFYYTTAEHSAQQSSKNLEKYEDRFKLGKKNVLNCSTTMEMGVDIGGISAVVMTNVPPHPANYLQRAGRAGRSSESRALGYTICKNNPHDQFVFNNPKWPFITAIPSPNVNFTSSKLVQRHVNAYLLGKFLHENVGTTQKEKLFLNLQWFYLTELECKPIYERFRDWLIGEAFQNKEALTMLVRGTVLQSSSIILLCEQADKLINDLAERWLKEYKYIQSELKFADPDGPYSYKLRNDERRLGGEYLLRDLATRGFLPGYGFPTDVVNLSVNSLTDYIRNKNIESRKIHSSKEYRAEREDNVSISRGMPSRNLAVAIREFAPGTEIVLDGRVHQSAGISLNWQNMHIEGAKDSQKFDVAWRCDSCGQTGYESELSNQGEISCSNLACARPIKQKYQKRVIQPTGFVVDFYKLPSNNIAHTHFIPVQKPWVIGKGERIPLPNPEIGYMLTDTAGNMFHHSSGLYSTGYALCLSCGKAESMTPSGECPKTLEPQSPHVPPLPNKFQRDDNDRPSCDGAGKILEGIHLGYNSTTDVFELVLRHPNSQEYINDITIATTLSVALRKALVRILGLSTNEVGYSTRPAIVNAGQEARVIQLFDMVSGGAGFCIAAANHIEQLLSNLFTILDCEDDCDRYCHSCLLDNDSRHDIDKLDRRKALEWIQQNIEQYVSLSSKYQSMLGEPSNTKYCPMTIKEKLSEIQRSKPDIISFVFSENVQDWDTSTAPLKAFFHNILKDEIAVQIIVPDVEFCAEITSFLRELKNIGVEILAINVTHPVVIQAVINHECITLGNYNKYVGIPGNQWLNSRETSVESRHYPQFNGKVLSFERPLSQGATEHQILNDINGSLHGFGERLASYLCNSDPRLKKLLDNEELQLITYTDRYIQNPVSMMLLAEVLSSFTDNNGAEIIVNTSFDEKKSSSSGFAINHDWIDENDYLSIFNDWLNLVCNRTIFLDIREKRDIPHRRSLEFSFKSGSKAIITLDQGFGYWKLRLQKGLHNFDFTRSSFAQTSRLHDVYKSADVYNSADWETWLTVSVNSKV